jgi:NitT/TauT family transport system permease protein
LRWRRSIIVVLGGDRHYAGSMPKAIISTYLCFFPVADGHGEGADLRRISCHLDLMRTYNPRVTAQTFWKLRVPASVPFLFASPQSGGGGIAMVGAIVA